MPEAVLQVPAGTYSILVDGVAETVTVPVLTAGTIDQVSPQVGDLLSVSGTNGSASATFQWQRGGVDIAGATGTGYDTTGQPSGIYRRAISDGLQGPVYTDAVTVTGAGGAAILVSDTFEAADGYAAGDALTVSPNWSALQISNAGLITARIATLGAVEFATTDSAETLRIAYDGTIGADQAIEVELDAIMQNNRADPILFARGAGNTPNGTMVRAFFRVSTSDLIFDEYENGTSLQNTVVSGIDLVAGDQLRLDVSGDTATMQLNGVAIATLTGLTITGGAPGFGAYLGQGSDMVSFGKAVVESLG